MIKNRPGIAGRTELNKNIINEVPTAISIETPICGKSRAEAVSRNPRPLNVMGMVFATWIRAVAIDT